MERLKKYSKTALTWGVISVTTLVLGTEISNRFAVIPSFKDDRYVSSLNSNFQRLTRAFVADGNFNVVYKGTSNVIVLGLAQTDANYGVFTQTSWASTKTVVMEKTTEHFKLEASTPDDVAGGRIDWILVR